MGARRYSALLGRFLEVDPIVGGVENAYVYPADPVNDFDVEGTDVCSGKSRNHTAYKYTSRHDGTVRLKCGTDAWGWRHIEAHNHMELNGFWSHGDQNRNLIKATLAAPSSRSVRHRSDGHTTITYKKRMQTCHCGSTVTMVVKFNENGTIITAYKENH